MTLLAAILLLFPQAEPRVTFSFKNEGLENIVKVIETYAGVKIDVAPQFRGRKVTIEARNRTIAEVLNLIGSGLGGSATKTGKDRFRLAPKWQQELWGKLQKEKVHGLLMEDVELAQALELMRMQCGVRVQIDPALDARKKIKFEADQVDYATVLTRIADAAGARWEMRYGVVFLSTAERFKSMPLLPPRIKDETFVTVHLQDKSIEDALRYLAVVTGRKIEWPKILPKTRVNLRAKKLAFVDVLALVLYPAGLTVEEKDDVLRVKK